MTFNVCMYVYLCAHTFVIFSLRVFDCSYHYEKRGGEKEKKLFMNQSMFNLVLLHIAQFSYNNG